MGGTSRGIGLLLVLGLGLGCDGDVGRPAGAARTAGLSMTSAGWVESADQLLGRWVAPGELSRAHEDLAGVDECTECHAVVGTTPDEKCGACHDDVVARMNTALGFHGGFSGACVDCHGEHEGSDAEITGLDREGFNHSLAAFPLRGAHTEVDCERCHTRAGRAGAAPGFHALGIDHRSCETCHADVHGADFTAGRDCGSCHSERSFLDRDLVRTGALLEGFVHGRDTAFALEGEHRPLACAACHTPKRHTREEAESLAPGTSVSRDCVTCHADPHDGALARGCESCHTAASWSSSEVPFDHGALTDFALDATHARLDCGACHADLGFAAKSTDCVGCHRDAAELVAGRLVSGSSMAADPHFGEVDCAGCHGERSHASSRLADELTCVGCHPAEYGSLLLDRRRILEELALEVETAARDRRTPPGHEEGRPALLKRTEWLAGSAGHHPELAEAALRDLLRMLEKAPGADR